MSPARDVALENRKIEIEYWTLDVGFTTSKRFNQLIELLESFEPLKQ